MERNPINTFKDAEKRCIGLGLELEKIAKEYDLHFFDAGSVTDASAVDGIHLDENQHQVLGKAITSKVSEVMAF